MVENERDRKEAGNQLVEQGISMNRPKGAPSTKSPTRVTSKTNRICRQWGHFLRLISIFHLKQQVVDTRQALREGYEHTNTTKGKFYLLLRDHLEDADNVPSPLELDGYVVRILAFPQQLLGVLAEFPGCLCPLCARKDIFRGGLAGTGSSNGTYSLMYTSM